ncbi:5-oxoprolinase subunit PxpA [uncultured Neptuniibacter sp.]|uniref:5-oxoprolinase subunit PxpA n=1 Tax=uncultured Neptuniibacter sp. TaxID=502143 RepID=UPI0026198582|nr:5-oxoprolinase subunit PxpA [uncultured Neptuniibacter sp.]
MKLNCDLGESFGAWSMGLDAEVMPYIHMANIACGFHASDPVIMEQTVQLAKRHQVEIGAHPGYPDLAGFGRRSMNCSEAEVRGLLLYQISALTGIAAVNQSVVTYVKPHGALYNDMMRNDLLLEQIMRTVAMVEPPLRLIIQATDDNSRYQSLADQYGIELMFEAFADRGYDDQGLLLPRSQPGAVFHDSQQILDRVLQLSEEGTVLSSSGKTLQLQPDTLCVHGDNQQSVALVAEMRQVLDAAAN